MSDSPNQLSRLLSIMVRLRDPDGGCEWDLAQNFATIGPYTIEEAYEVADAIERGYMRDLREELGDLLFQVVFHSRLAEEVGEFNFYDVARAICDKMENRHPHIFNGKSGGMNEHRWESLKQAERFAKGAASSMDGVANALPALLRAQKLQKRAARDGFDWPDKDGPKAKVAEELEELAVASSENQEEEAGDLLFAVVNLIRAYGIDSERALRRANDKFARRYRSMEALSNGTIAGLDLDEQESLWSKVKAAEPKRAN